MTTVSVIIPCYNQGLYLQEAYSSVLAQTLRDFEIIIVNDGSTDDETNRIISEIEDDYIRVITTSNQGLASARNNGIAEADGAYILPLDADDRIGPEYLERAVAVIESNPAIGIVYCKAELFGSVNTAWALPPYSLEEMLKDNVIFCSALFRRKDWEDVGGYDSGMIYGWEDYDFWLSLIERGGLVQQLQGTHFYYRVSADSMVRSKEKWQKVEMFKRIFQRHKRLFSQNIDIWLNELVEMKEQYRICQLYIDSGDGFNEKQSIKRKITNGKHRLTFDLTSYSNILKLRFDPMDCPVIVQLDGIVIRTATGNSKIPVKDLDGNFLLSMNNTLLYSENDPNLCFPDVSVFEDIQAITIELTIDAHDRDALHKIIPYLLNTRTNTPVELIKRGLCRITDTVGRWR